jgi:hypothetical protein
MKTSAIAALLIGVGFAWPAASQSNQGAVPAFPMRDCSRLGEIPKIWEGKAFAMSGDVLSGIGLRAQIKLWGITVSGVLDYMIDTVPALRARAALEDMLVSGEHKVSCRMIGVWDQFCRIEAQCAITASWPTGSALQPHDLALRLVEDGFAYGSGLASPPEWDKDASEKVAHFEAIARQARKGLWPIWLGEQTIPKP